MRKDKPTAVSVVWLAALAGCGILLSSGASAAFLKDAEGALVSSGNGSCVHTGDWQPAMGACPAPTQAPAQAMVVRSAPATLSLALDDSAFFGFDKARLTDLAREHLYPLVVAARNADSIVSVDITGHADPMGTAIYNDRLALRRAESVRNYLSAEGLPSDRIQAKSDGERAPLVTCPTVSGKAQRIQCLAPDRRVDVVAVLRDNLVVTARVPAPPAGPVS